MCTGNAGSGGREEGGTLWSPADAEREGESQLEMERSGRRQIGKREKKEKIFLLCYSLPAQARRSAQTAKRLNAARVRGLLKGRRRRRACAGIPRKVWCLDVSCFPPLLLPPPALIPTTDAPLAPPPFAARRPPVPARENNSGAQERKFPGAGCLPSPPPFRSPVLGLGGACRSTDSVI